MSQGNTSTIEAYVVEWSRALSLALSLAYYMIKDVHICLKNCFLSTHILLKSPVVAVIYGGKGSLT